MNKRIGTLTSVFFFVTAVCVTSAFASPTTTPRTMSQLRSVRLLPADGSIQVVLGLSGSVRYNSQRTAEPSRITIDLPQTGISPVFTKRELLSIHPALIRVLITRSNGATRAVIDLAAAGSHTVYAVSNELIVEIKTRTSAPNTRVVPTPLQASAVPPVGVLPGAAPQMPEFTIGASENRLKIPWVPLGPRVEDFTSPNRPPVGARVSNFRQREPGEGSPISEETTTYVSYDNENLYAVFVCRNQRSDLRSHLVPRDAISQDDQVALYLDTFDDGRHAYVFASNAYGVQQDGVISDGDDLSYTADMLWRSDGRVTSEGFVVLMAIPFKSLRFAARSDQSWRIAVGRTIADRNESAFWPYITRQSSRFVQQMAPLDGLELISPGRNVQLTPYGTFAHSQSFDPSPFGNSVSDIRSAGLDAKMVIKNAVTIDAALRPDFSEVESDDPLVRVNQRFELFLPEKRPFFMENAAVFDTPIKVFFSRRIIDPEFGVRVTTRSSGWAMGGLMANDRGIALDASRRNFGSGTRIGVARLQRFMGERSSVGVLATERNDSQGINRVVSIDGRLQMTPAWSFSGQAIRSEDDQDGQREAGGAYAAAVARRGPRFTYVGGYRDVGSTIRVPLGFVPRSDIRVTDHYAGYVWRVGDSGAWSFGPAVNAVVDWDHTGQMQDRWANADFGISHAGHLDLHVSRAEGSELFAMTPFRPNATNVSASSSIFRWLSIWGQYSSGAAINYTPAAGVAPFLGSNQGVYASVTFRPSARLDLEQMVLRQQLETMSGSPSGANQPVFATNIFRWKGNLQISRSLALRGVVDHNRLDSEPTLFAEPGYRGLMYDLLVKYLVHPGTAVYIGINKQYVGAVTDQATPLPLPFRWTSLPRVPVGQQIFVKMSYLLRF
jgi:hypothetical protein